MTTDTFKMTEIFLYIVVSKQKQNDYNNNFKKSAVKMF